MLNEFEPKDYLSKRENGTYCVISAGMPLNVYGTKARSIEVAERYNIALPDVVWDAKTLSFIEE